MNWQSASDRSNRAGRLQLSSENRVEGSVRAFWATLTFLSIIALASAQSETPSQVEIDLSQQTAYLIRGRHVVLQSPISSGRLGHLTETGSFKVIEKERNHYSSIYGKIVDASGRTIVADADVDMKLPPGGKFVPAPMPWFMRFHGADGMHAGFLPGYPASHGCVRMPEDLAVAFYQAIEVGTPVTVFGRAPKTSDYSKYGPQPQRRPWSWFGRGLGPQPERVYPSQPVNPWWQ